MRASYRCPECGADLPADAPGGLCPRCLMGAGIAGVETMPAGEPGGAGEDQEAVFGPSAAEIDGGRPANPVDLDQFKRAAVELGLIRADEFERFVTGALGGVPGVARALVRAGKLTPYQAGALSQGKARGLVIGNYFILDKLGAGGMGVVFKARHRRLGRVVALKILPPSLARDANLLSRFRREVDVAARLSHPNIVSVLDADQDRGVQFMTMEFVEGNDLDRLVREGGVLPVDQALDCVIQAARGLEAAHAQGVVHRDIKPGNLMLNASGQVRVLDLGLARLVEASNPFGETASGPLTKSGTYMGTVDFMAPEQGIDSRRVDHRADIYSLGCTLCYLLTGRAPFDGATVLARLMAHQDRPPSSLLAARPDVPTAVDSVYQKMMAKKPADRPASMTEVVEVLEACRSSAGNIELARSGLMTLAATVTMKRASPRETVREPVFDHDLPEGVQLSTGPVVDDRDQGRLVAPVTHTLVEAPALISKQIGSDQHGTIPRLKSPAFMLGAFALVAAASVGCFLIWRNAGKSAVDRGSVSDSASSAAVARAPERAPSINPVPERGQTAELAERSASVELAPPRSAAALVPSQKASPPYATFDVTTIHTIYGGDRHAASVETIAVTADGRRALIGSWTEHCYLIDVDTDTRPGPHLGPEHNGWLGARPSVAMTPDGRRSLIGTHKVREDNFARAKVKKTDGILWFLDPTTGKQLFPKSQPYAGPVASVAISPDGLRGLSASWAGQLTLWDLTTGKRELIGTQQGKASAHDMPFFPMAFFPDGRHAASAVHDKFVHIWDLETGLEQALLRGHDSTISGLSVSADGRRIVTGSFDGTVILWDVAQASILHRFEMPPNDKGACVAFDSDGNIVAAGNGLESDGSEFLGNLIVWDANNHTVLRRDEKPFAQHLAVASLPDGRVLTGDEHGLRLWTPRESGDPAGAAPATANPDTTPVDLLALVDEKTTREGEWQIGSGELLSQPKAGGRLQFPYTPPAAYRIDIEVELVGKENDYGFALGFVVGGRQTEITIDKMVGSNRYTGLNGLDGAPVDRNDKAHRGQLLLPARVVRFSLTVRGSAINLTCNGSSVVNWSGDPRRLIRLVLWRVPDRKSLFLCSGSSIRFRKMILTPLTAASP